ncbi:MAG: response regulator transcription factor [Micromonosporaceae bacterium]|nr:response regulator transcription factor [Micromonosporaceae bacterium]
MRQGVREMLSTDPRIVVRGEGATGAEAIELAAGHRPDVLLLDIEMPGPGAAAVIQRIATISPKTRVIVLTMHDDPDMVYELLDCGAAAYLLKTILRDELVAAVHTTCRSPSSNVLLSVSRQTVERLDRQRPRECGPVLTERELEVLRLVAEAMSNSQIASRLFISPATVKRHITNIYAKLGAVSRVDAVRKAMSHKIIKHLGLAPLGKPGH